MIEFADFQCPFCRKYFTQTFQKVKNNYVDTGKVRYVYRDFPLDQLHPRAQKAAEAAECAQDQGKFWQYHDKIFNEQAKQGQGTIQFSINDLKTWASQIGMDTETFNQCLSSGKYSQEV
ncbi:MAG: DsbA family protein, partial [Halobacteriaceae archaeon]